MAGRAGFVTGSMLYDLESCEHRPWMDLYADSSLRDPVSPFVEMLWRRGQARKEDVLASLGMSRILNLAIVPSAERERVTLEALDRKEPLIYGGLICAGDLLADPDLLRFEEGSYVPGDIKSGAGEEGPPGGDRSPKVRYGVHSYSAGRRAFVWDVHGHEVGYDLTAPRGPRSPSLWETYEEDLAKARAIIANEVASRAAYGTACKQCWWLSACLEELERSDDLTLIHELGRSRRDPLIGHVTTISDLASLPLSNLISEKGKSAVKGFTPESLSKFRDRAILRTSNSGPYLKSPIRLPSCDVQLFFDIETDPTLDHCYLHGFVERHAGRIATEQYHGFFSTVPTQQGEREAFATAWAFVQSRLPCAIFIYSKYERTWWRILQERHPDVCTAKAIEDLFAFEDTVDLYDVVSQNTEWPTRDYSLKNLAAFLGFAWRDTHPSGAASIEWYDRYLHGELGAKERILEYNEDDCRATRVLLDGIMALRRSDGAQI